MILTKTPYRVSLFGGGTDYPEWFMHHGGAVLGMAINKYVFVGVQEAHVGQIYKYRVQYSHIDDCQTVSEIQHPAIRAALRYYGIDTPLEFHCFGELPGRAGLGSSSSFCVGMLKALQAHFNLPSVITTELASETIAFERHMIPETVGFQDQIFAAVGGINLITFGKTGSIVKRITMDPERQQELEQSLILVYSGNMRDAHVMAKKQVEGLGKEKDRTAPNLLTELALFGEEVLTNDGYPVDTIGDLLDEAWRAKVALCPEVTTPEIDKLYTHGLRCGAIGGKLLGAGGGGFILFFVPVGNKKAFEQNIGSPHTNFSISQSGSEIISS